MATYVVGDVQGVVAPVQVDQEHCIAQRLGTFDVLNEAVVQHYVEFMWHVVDA